MDQWKGDHTAVCFQWSLYYLDLFRIKSEECDVLDVAKEEEIARATIADINNQKLNNLKKFIDNTQVS